jgi:hypothetical protein
MQIVECQRCHGKNRVPGYRLGARATCGKCGAFLPEPRLLSLTRKGRAWIRMYWVPLAGVAALAGYYLLPVFNKHEQPVVTPAWAPAPMTTPPVATTPAPEPPAVRDPIVGDIAPIKVDPVVLCTPKKVRSGAKRYYGVKQGHVPLKITTPPGENYLFSLTPVNGEDVIMKAYVAGGDTKEFRVPDGTYSIYVETGSAWCGFDKEFGGNGNDVSKLDANFAFTSTMEPGVGIHYRGQQIDITPQLMGNMKSERVGRPGLHPAGTEQPDGDSDD